ncbi:MAG: phosphosulfolactate synthase [Gammaproteobacteria bacterium]
MERRFLEFLDLAERSQKPRSRGLTAVLEQAQSISVVRDTLDVWSEYIDCVKFPITCVSMPWRAVEERVKLYRDYKVSTAIDDPMFAIAYFQGKTESYLRTVRDLGFTNIQIDTHFMRPNQTDSRADDDERRYFALAQELGLKVEGEVGQKWEEGDRARAGHGRLNVEAIVAEARRLLAAGCVYIYLESRVLREAIGDYGERQEGAQQIRQIVEAIGLDKIFIEITGQLPFDVRMCHRFWAVRNFGPDVNMGGGELIEEMRYIEGIRRGITFVKGPSRGTSMLWLKSLAQSDGHAAEKWWEEEYIIDPSLVKRSSHGA